MQASGEEELEHFIWLYMIETSFFLTLMLRHNDDFSGFWYYALVVTLGASDVGEVASPMGMASQ